ncbi:MAG: murein L,D-transpeptidase catalytic domain family protein [Deltaproteobacteria bacterium]|nr:murein L,D-transpeptidase catalytic domain family protein [Deltaproteobacteria bacterium]
MNRLLNTIALLATAGLVGCTLSAEDDPQWGSGSLYGTETDAECPAGVMCIDSLPFFESNTTEGSGAVFDVYSCDDGINESGPEMVYRVDVATEGLLVASLAGLGEGVDVDVHILDELNAQTCIDRGHWDAATLAKPGRYWIVVDSWSDGETVFDGSYQLTIALTTADDHQDHGLHPTVLTAGLRAFSRGWQLGDTEQLEYGIIDYGMPSTEHRFFVLDLRAGDLLRAELVSHGEGSQDPNDAKMATSLSNVTDSHKSSMGLARGAETYYGNHGYSMRLDGLEPGYNDNDRGRTIVVHNADYATQSYINSHGYLGRSWGCPAISPSISESLINSLKNGGLILKYFDDESWLANSDYVGP